MHIIKLNLKKRPYNIIVGTDILRLLGRFVAKLKIGNDAYIITNKKIKNKYGRILEKTLKASSLNARFKTVPDTEESKSIESSSKVIKDLVRFDKKRKVFIVAFGGGVIGDLSGFIASIYKRGVPYIQIPTTLLAQVDSSIGGKTAVDLREGKNLIGAFYQPRLVFSDVKLLNTLDKKQIRSGLAEVIKYGIIRDARLFSFLEKKYTDILTLNLAALEHIIGRCSFIKASIVEQDEKEEKGLRTILNFGHTLGHAIEAAGGFKKYNHGEAVGLGMLIATVISRRLGLINNNVKQRIEGLIEKAGLPRKIEKVSLQKIINAFYRDKKFIGTKNRLVLIKGIGKTKIVENIPLGIIKEAVKERF
jgi:3-dehydroquinate synthase